MDNLIDWKYGGTGECGVLVMKKRMTDSGASTVDENAKSDASDASNASKINTPKIGVKRGIVKPSAVSIKLSQRVSLRHKALRDAQSDGNIADTGKFDANKKSTK